MVVNIAHLHWRCVVTDPRPVSKRVLGKGLGSLMDRANAVDSSTGETSVGAGRMVSAAPSTGPGPGLRQFIRVNVSPDASSMAPVSETASSPSPTSAAPAKRFSPAPLPVRRAPSLGIVPLGLLLADATILGLSLALLKASPAPSLGRILVCSAALAVACVAGCLAVVAASEES